MIVDAYIFMAYLFIGLFHKTLSLIAIDMLDFIFSQKLMMMKKVVNEEVWAIKNDPVKRPLILDKFNEFQEINDCLVAGELFGNKFVSELKLY